MVAYTVRVYSRTDDAYSRRNEATLVLGADRSTANAAFDGATRPKGLRKARRAFVELVEVRVEGEMVIEPLARPAVREREL